MAELVFVGMGLSDERDLTLRAVDELRATPVIYAEMYTSRLAPGSLERLGEILGRPVQELSREALEAEATILEALKRSPRVALLVVGEPFAATTHVSLRRTAEAHGHRWRILHNASILTAAASLLGLSHYKFGRVVSLPYPTEHHAPTSPYEAIGANVRAGLHTLVLLDLDPAAARYLTADHALRRLGEIERERGEGILPPDRNVAVVARAGTPTAQCWYGPRRLLEGRDFGPPLHSVVIPALPLHFVEEEALRSWAVPGDG